MAKMNTAADASDFCIVAYAKVKGLDFTDTFHSWKTEQGLPLAQCAFPPLFPQCTLTPPPNPLWRVQIHSQNSAQGEERGYCSIWQAKMLALTILSLSEAAHPILPPEVEMERCHLHLSLTYYGHITAASGQIFQDLVKSCCHTTPPAAQCGGFSSPHDQSCSLSYLSSFLSLADKT